MYLIAPTGVDELEDRARWFKKPNARKLVSKFNIEFGFELKGDTEDLGKAPPLFWGIHLDYDLATSWYFNPEKRSEIIHEATKIAKFKPNYAVLHGIHLKDQPPKKDYVGRFINRTSVSENLKIYRASIELIDKLKHYFPLKIENTPLTSFYFENGELLPNTFYYSGVGKLNDLVKLKKDGIDILVDVEHLITTLNFLNREKNYHNLPIENIENLTLAEKKAFELFGFYLKKGYIPYSDNKLVLKDWIKKIGAKYYHLTGSTQDVEPNQKVLAHGPIELGDKTFRKHLRIVLAKKPEVLVLETSNSKEDKCFSHLRPNETEISFDIMCEILLEEL